MGPWLAGRGDGGLGGEKISKPVDCTREGGDQQVGRVGRAGPHNSGIERGRRQRVRSGRVGSVDRVGLMGPAREGIKVSIFCNIFSNQHKS
jgi:hypothetical protein